MMASNFLNRQSSFGDIIECPICTTIFNTSSNKPKRLKCQHTFCSSCIPECYEGGRLTCPICHSPHMYESPAPDNLLVKQFDESFPKLETKEVLYKEAKERRDQLHHDLNESIEKEKEAAHVVMKLREKLSTATAKWLEQQEQVQTVQRLLTAAKLNVKIAKFQYSNGNAPKSVQSGFRSNDDDNEVYVTDHGECGGVDVTGYGEDDIQQDIEYSQHINDEQIQPLYNYDSPYSGREMTDISSKLDIQNPIGIAMFKNGSFVLCDWGNQRLQIISKKGKPLINDVIGEECQPYGIATNNLQEIIFSDISNQTIQVYTKEGEHVREIKFNSFAFGICVVPKNKKNWIYVAFDKQIRVLNSMYEVVKVFKSKNFKALTYMAYREGLLYVTDSKVSVIHVVTIWGKYVKKLGVGMLEGPRGISVDRVGNLIVGEFDGKRITILSPEGDVLDRLGEGQLGNVQDIILTRKDEIIACDYGSNRIVKFD